MFNRRVAALALLLSGCAPMLNTQVLQTDLPVLERIDVLVFSGSVARTYGGSYQVHSAAHLVALHDYFPEILKKNGLQLDEFYFTTQAFSNNLIRMSEKKTDTRFLLVVQSEKVHTTGPDTDIEYALRLIDRSQRKTVWTGLVRQRLLAKKPRKEAAMIASSVLQSLEKDKLLKPMKQGPVDLAGAPIGPAWVWETKDD